MLLGARDERAERDPRFAGPSAWRAHKIVHDTHSVGKPGEVQCDNRHGLRIIRRTVSAS